MTIPYPPRATFYKIFIVDNYHQTLRALDTTFPDREAAALYGYRYMKDMENLTEDQRVHANDLHVYLQPVALEHVATMYHNDKFMIAEALSGKWKEV